MSSLLRKQQADKKKNKIGLFDLAESVTFKKYERPFYILILSVATFIIFCPLIANDNYFLSEDFGIIQLHHGKPTLHFLKLFYTDWTEGIFFETDELRPTTAYTYKLDWDLWGLRPAGFHLTNVLLHIVNVLLTFWIASIITNNNHWIGLVAGLLFAVTATPNAETVGWIHGRSDSMAAVFFLGTFLCFILFRVRQSYTYYVLSFALCTLGLFTKESVIVLPFTLLVYDLYYNRSAIHKSWRQALIKRIFLYSPFFAVLVFYLGLRHALFGSMARESTISLATFLDFIAKQGAYLSALLMHVNIIDTGKYTIIAPNYSRAVEIVLGAITVGIWLTWAFLFWRRRFAYRESIKHLMFFGPIWYILTFSPFFVVYYYSPRHLYLTAAGTCIGLAVLLFSSPLTPFTRLNRARLASLGFVLIFFTITLVKDYSRFMQAGQQSLKMKTDIETLSERIPHGSRIVLAIHHPGDYTAGWSEALPYLFQRPFSYTDLCSNFQVIEHMEMYCCLVAHGAYWEHLKNWLAPLLSGEADNDTLYVMYSDVNMNVALKTKKINGSELKSQIEGALNRPMEEIGKNLTIEEAQTIIGILGD